jgi:hypothetical protein
MLKLLGQAVISRDSVVTYQGHKKVTGLTPKQLER